MVRADLLEEYMLGVAWLNRAGAPHSIRDDRPRPQLIRMQFNEAYDLTVKAAVRVMISNGYYYGDRNT